MPGNPNNPTSVSLDVRNFSSEAPWVNVNGSNGAPYSYLYTGGNAPGNKNNGDCEFGIGGGNAAITLTLVADQRYQIDVITFVNDTAPPQLSTQGNAPRTRVINNKCTEKLPPGTDDTRYKVRVVDTGAGNATVQCDPVIINK